MLRRWVAPILRILAFFAILLIPLALAAIAQSAQSAQSAEPGSLVTLRSVTLGEKPADRWPAGARLSGSQPARLVERRAGWLLVSVETPRGSVQGWAEEGAFLLLDDPAQTVSALLDRARIVMSDRPVLAAAFLSEAVRREPRNAEALLLLGSAGEAVARRERPSQGEPSLAVTLARRWGVELLPTPKGWRYDGAAYRAAAALGGPFAEQARFRLLECGLLFDPAHPDLAAAAAREKDIADLLAAVPGTPSRVKLLMERARLLAALAEGSLREGRRDAALRFRDAAIEVASEVGSSAPVVDEARRKGADRLITRMARSFPRQTESEKPAVSAGGLRARFVARGVETFLEVTRADGRPAIQPHAVVVPDAATLAFDPTGTKLAWDETPEPGRRRTRVLHLDRATVVEMTGAAPELIVLPGAAATARPDRYTSFLGFSPDGASLLVLSEGFLPDGTRIPRRHYVCDAEGKRLPALVEAPFGGASIDWARVLAGQPRA